MLAAPPGPWRGFEIWLIAEHKKEKVASNPMTDDLALHVVKPRIDSSHAFTPCRPV